MTKPLELQLISHQLSAMLIMLKYLICLRFLYCCCFSPFGLTWKSFVTEAHTSRKLQDYENIHWGDSFLITWKISGRRFFPFSPATLQKHTWTATFLWSYLFKKIVINQCQNKWNKDFLTKTGFVRSLFKVNNKKEN